MPELSRLLDRLTGRESRVVGEYRISCVVTYRPALDSDSGCARSRSVASSSGTSRGHLASSIISALCVRDAEPRNISKHWAQGVRKIWPEKIWLSAEEVQAPQQMLIRRRRIIRPRFIHEQTPTAGPSQMDEFSSSLIWQYQSPDEHSPTSGGDAYYPDGQVFYDMSKRCPRRAEILQYVETLPDQEPSGCHPPGRWARGQISEPPRPSVAAARGMQVGERHRRAEWPCGHRFYDMSMRRPPT